MGNNNNKNKAKEKALSLALAYSKVFESEEGRTVLFDLMRVTNFDRSPFSSDPYSTAFEAGRQSIVHEIVRAMNLDIEKYLQLVVDSDTERQGEMND